MNPFFYHNIQSAHACIISQEKLGKSGLDEAKPTDIRCAARVSNVCVSQHARVRLFTRSI